MGDFLKVARWEIKKMVKSKTFLIMTFIVPVVILLLGGIVGYFTARNTKPESLKIGLVDKTGVMSEEIKGNFNRGKKEMVILQEDIEDYKKTIKKYNLDGILVLPENIFTENVAYYYFNDLIASEVVSLKNIVSPAVGKTRLIKNDYNPEKIYNLTRNVEISQKPLEKAGTVTSVGSMYLPFGLAMLMVFASIFSGGMLMQSIIKEKSNRIVELILSSISANSLMTGKVIGYGILGFIQISIWAVTALIVAKVFFDISLNSLVDVKLVYMLIYFILGFILTASINAIVGAGMKEAQSGTQSTGLLVIIPVIPIYFTGAIIGNPAGTISRVLSFIPFTTATTMLIRLGFSTPSLVEILLTIFILLIGNYLLIRLSAKIFRIGMLMYGKSASFKELLKWART